MPRRPNLPNHALTPGGCRGVAPPHNQPAEQSSTADEKRAEHQCRNGRTRLSGTHSRGAQGVVPPHNQPAHEFAPLTPPSPGSPRRSPQTACGRGGTDRSPMLASPRTIDTEEAPRELWLAPPPSRGSSCPRCTDPFPDRSQPGLRGHFRTLVSTVGFVAEAPARAARPVGSSPETQPGGRLSRTRSEGRASPPPPKQRLQTQPRTRLVNRSPDPPGRTVSGPSVGAEPDHVRRRPARPGTPLPVHRAGRPLSRPPPLAKWCRRSLGDRGEGKRSSTCWEPESVASFRDERRVFASPRMTQPERGKPRESIGRSLNPLGAPCRSHSCPKAGLFPATKGTSRSLQPASGSPPLQ